MSVKLKVAGLRELQAALVALPDEVEKPSVTDALVDSGQPMAELAASTVRRRSGHLSEAIDIAADNQDNPDPHRAEAAVGPKRGRGGAAGILVELGTGLRHWKSGKSTGQMPAFPFLRPAFDAEGRKTVERFKPKLWAIVQRAARIASARARVITPGQRPSS